MSKYSISRNLIANAIEWQFLRFKSKSTHHSKSITLAHAPIRKGNNDFNRNSNPYFKRKSSLIKYIIKNKPNSLSLLKSKKNNLNSYSNNPVLFNSPLSFSISYINLKKILMIYLE